MGIDLPIGRFVIKNTNEEHYKLLIIYILDKDGSTINNIISSKDEEIVEFKEGYIVNSHYNYILKAKK